MVPLFSFHQILVSGSRDKLEGVTSGRRQVDVACVKSGLSADVRVSTGTVPQADCLWTSKSEHGEGEKDDSREGTNNTQISVPSLLEQFMRIILITITTTTSIIIIIIIENVSRIWTKHVFR